MVPHVKKLTNKDTPSLFDESSNVSGFMAQIFSLLSEKSFGPKIRGPVSKFGHV